MIRTLIWKEFRQHWAALILLAGLALLGFVLIAAWSFQGGMAGSSFEGLKLYVAWFLPLAALLLANRLVVAEFGAGTQLFLEALPVSRTRMIAVKFVLGFAGLALLFALGFVLSMLLGFRHEVLSFQFAGFIALRSLGYLFPIYALCFMMGLLGRYRIPLYILLLIALFTVDSFDLFELGDFGPFALVDDRFAYERNVFPWDRFREAAAVGGGFAMLAWLLTVLREGDVSAILAEKMSLREKVFVSVALLGTYSIIGIVMERVPPEPYDLTGAEAVSDDRATVKVEGGDAEQARSIAQSLHREIAGLAEYLGIENLPPVFVVLRRSLDADTFEEAELPENEGFLARANFAADSFDVAALLEWLAPRLLIRFTEERSAMEHRRWLLDGLAHHWIIHHSDFDPDSRTAHESLMLRRAEAALGSIEALDRETVEQWLKVRDTLGEPLAEALSWALLEGIRQHAGDEALRAVLAQTVARRVPKDVRALAVDPVWRRWSPLRKDAGWTPEALCAHVTERFASGAPTAVVAGSESTGGEATFDDSKPEPLLPADLRCDVRLERDSAGTAQLHYEVAVSPGRPSAEAAGAAGGEPLELVFRYAEVPPFDVPVPETDVSEIATEAHDGTVSDRLDRSFPDGTRIACQAAVFSEALQCRIFTPWQRLEVGARP